MTDRDAITQAIGWLQGFSPAIWALCEVQRQEVVATEAVADYDELVKRLGECWARICERDQRVKGVVE